MTRFTQTAAAALLGLGFATAAAAQDFPRVVGSGENASVEYAMPSANIVGGALSRSLGSGESESMQVFAVQNVQPGRIARLVGSGENQSVIYDAPAAAPLASTARGVRG